MQKFVYVFILLLSLTNFNSLAQTGCYYATETRIYTSVDGLGVWYAPLNLNCTSGNSTYAANLVKKTPNIKCTAIGHAILGGDEYTYNILNCSMDDYIIILFIICSSLGFCAIRKRIGRIINIVF